MQCLNIKELNIFELHTNKQCKHSIVGVDVTMSKFNTHKSNIKYAQNIRYTCSICEKSLRLKFEYEGMKTS